LAWQRFDGSNQRVQARVRSAAGTLAATHTLSAAGQDATEVHVAVDPSGDAVFAWVRFDGTVDRIQTRARSAAGTLSSTQTLSAAGRNAYDPRVAVDLNGNAVFLWQRFDGILSRVQARARTVAGTLSPTQTLGDTGTTIPLGAHLAVDPHVCCTRVEARVRSADSTLGLTQFLSPADQVGSGPAVAVDPNGNALAVWKETTTGNASVPDSKIHAAVGQY
jgi:hypothetical protein